MTLFFLFFSAVPVDALSLSPALVEVKAEPGETLIQKIRLFNETNQTITVYPSLENFQPQLDGSQPKFLGDNDPFGAARWIEVQIKQVILKSGEAKDLLLKIKVSAVAEPGGHYAALFWSNRPGKNLGIGSASRLAQLFLFKVKGAIKEDARIISFVKKENDVSLEFTLRLENFGTVHLAPQGSIEIVNWRNKKVKEIKINALGQSILPQSQRQFDVSLTTDKLALGFYSARVKLFYGESGKELNSKINFWIMPTALFSKLLGLAIVIILIWLGIIIARRKSRVFVLFFIFYLALARPALATSSATSDTTTVSGTYNNTSGACTGCGGGGSSGGESGDTIAPSAVANLIVDATTDTTATLKWTAPGDDNNSGTASQYDIRYSLAAITAANWANATSIDNEPTVQVSGSGQSVIISNLTPNTPYYFALKTADEKPNWSNLSNVASASTLPASQQPADTTPPEISQIIARPGVVYAIITWLTNESADSQVYYGLTNQLGSSKTSANFVADHTITLSALTPDTTYYFKIISADAAGNQSIGLYNGAQIGTFKTAPDITAPANVSNFKATGGDKKIDLTWHNPSDSDFQGVLLVRNSNHYPTNTEDGEEAFLINGTKNSDASYTDSKNLVNGQTYYYTAFAMDLYNNVASGAMAQAMPSAGSQPPASGGASQCSDSVDNDGDGYIDYPSDLGCVNPSDNDETESAGAGVPVGSSEEPIFGGSGGAGGATIEELQLSDFIFSVAKGKIIVPNNFNISALAGSGLQISLSQTKILKAVDSIIVNVAGGSYLFSLQNGQWQTEISAPPQA
ncbi:MAG: fibronectin type III domain-containing protein, partial [Candidatus Magasanikbacteria bacterium]|nr:fibronectin type III domain-containing protein [Candidatus Magasanikbacteria bacterium]